MLNVTDADGDPLTYTLVNQPVSSTITGMQVGSVTVTSGGVYTFTPTLSARDKAAQTSQVDTVTFVVRAQDNSGAFKDVGVTAEVAPLPLPPNQPPVATAPVINSRNTATGVVTGSFTSSDPDGNTLTYNIVNPTKGTVSVTRQGDTYAYTYTPSQAQRFAALNTTEADYDQFAVLINDGRASTTVNISVPVLPANFNNTTFGTYLAAGTDPTSVTVVGDKAFVLNSGNKTLSVLTAGPYPSQIANVALDTAPTAVGVSAHHHRAYIGGNGSVTVINTDDFSKVSTIATNGGQIYGIAVSPDGTKVYATNTTAGTVSIIDTSTNVVVGTIQVGASPSGVAFTPDGKFAYVANMGSNTVTVIDAATNIANSRHLLWWGRIRPISRSRQMVSGHM